MSKFRSGVMGVTLTSALVLAAVSANAADIYRGERGGLKDGPVYAPVTSWTGFYIGVNGGYAFDANDNEFRDLEGGFGGGQIGYNFQSGGFVFGVEADFQGSGIDDKGRATVAGLGAGTTSTSIDYFGTVRGRVGFTADRALIYATGGFAFADVEDKFTTLNGARFKADDTITGYTVGGGIEYKINPAWSLKTEYQYISLEGEDLKGPAGRVRGDDIELHTIRAGLNYHFHKEYEPLK